MLMVAAFLVFQIVTNVKMMSNVSNALNYTFSMINSHAYLIVRNFVLNAIF